jgi:hypothetical protein
VQIPKGRNSKSLVLVRIEIAIVPSEAGEPHGPAGKVAAPPDVDLRTPRWADDLKQCSYSSNAELSAMRWYATSSSTHLRCKNVL